MATTIHVNSNLLREPRLFDNLRDVVGAVAEKKDDKLPRLGGQVGRLARDLILYAAWNGAKVVRLHVPEFCAMFDYDRAMLLRKTTPAQNQEMRACSLPEHLLKHYGNFLGYTLVKMGNYNFLWAERTGDSRDTSVRPHQIVEKIAAPCIRRKRGSYVEFTVSTDIVEQDRARYQKIYIADYLALRTKGGHAWDDARTLYLRVRWKRAWWDAPKVPKEPHPSRDSYKALVAAAGLKKIIPARNQASKLLAMLRQVGKLPSVCMVPQMHYVKGRYYVTWTRYELHTVGGPPQELIYEVSPAPKSWGTDPNPPSLGDRTDDDDDDQVYLDTSFSFLPVTTVWDNCLRRLRKQVGEQSYRTWFVPLVPVELVGKVLTIRVPSVSFYEHLEDHYVSELKQAIYQELGSDGRLEYSMVVEPSAAVDAAAATAEMEA